MLKIDVKELEFAVVFIKGKEQPIAVVYDPDGSPVEGVDLKQYPLDNINELECLLIGHKPNNSPCCIVWGGMKYCWCSPP